MKRLGLVLIVLALIASAVLGHVLMTRAPGSPLTVGVLLGPMVGLTALWLWSARQRLLAVALVLGLALLIRAVGQGKVQTEAIYVAQHAGIHLALGAWFASTLRTTPLIVQVARRVHDLTPDMHAYATQVTRAWVIYFVVMATVSVALYALAPFAAWSFFANVVTPVALVVMFVGEHLLRYRLHPEFERVTLRAAVDAWRRGG
jgi:uncharacterized membrane protein